MKQARQKTGSVTLQLAGMDRRGSPHFLDDQGQHWRSANAEFRSTCKWCGAKLPLHSDLVLTPENAEGIMYQVCLDHVRIRTEDDTTVPAADWFAQQPKRGPKTLHYDGGRPNVTTWDELEDWRYDIEERHLRLEAREQELRAREAEGHVPREEIGAFLAAEKVLEKERLAMSAIWLATWDSALTKFQSEDETLEEVARREGWPSITPPLVFPE